MLDATVEKFMHLVQTQTCNSYAVENYLLQGVHAEMHQLCGGNLSPSVGLSTSHLEPYLHILG
jgi:hypothetical protein